jgi:uncharacterized surface protein with fasciclin (FAS1) repeats
MAPFLFSFGNSLFIYIRCRIFLKQVMKNICLFFLSTLIGTSVMAQKADSLVALPKIKGVKATLVNGSTMTANMNIIQNVANSKDYSVLLSAIKTAGLTETFTSKGPITIFAPTNKAFSKMPAGKLDSLLKPENKYVLSNLITYHAISGKVSAHDISQNIKDHKGSATFITLAGSKLVATIDANRNIILTDECGGQCVISQFDVEQSNGMLHVVNSVFVPKNKAI